MKSNLITLRWLVRRELWEHKGMVVWAQGAVAAMITALVAGALVIGKDLQFNFDGRAAHMKELIQPQSQQAFAAAVSQMYMAIGAPLYFMLGFLVFFYCLGALHDDRRDRSLLFWKSLPISDHMTVLSKALVALVVTPVVTLLAATTLSLVVILLVCLAMAFHGVNLFGAVLGNPQFYLAPLRMAGLLPVYLLWALPTVGWLLLVSSWARSKVFLWAVGIPLGAAVLVTWANKVFALQWNTQWFMEQVVARLLASIAPGSWFMFSRIPPEDVVKEGSDHVDMADMFIASWGTLSSPVLWVGVVAGLAMLAGAVWMRRWREEG